MKNRKRYQKWIRHVREAAEKEWRANDKPTSSAVEVTISNYYTEAPPDVDNIIKPILDALKTLVYRDDAQVRRVTSEKLVWSSSAPIGNPSVLLAEALRIHSEVVHVVVT